MPLNDNEKRWLEINFYLLCNKIFKNNNNYEDVLNFLKGFRWTNLYDCDILIKTLNDTNLLFNTEIIPKQYEFILHLITKPCRFKYSNKTLFELKQATRFRLSETRKFTATLRERTKENPAQIYPKIDIKDFHDNYYSFLLTLRYINRNLEFVL